METLTYNLKDWQKGYESQTEESSYWIDNIEGEIPREISGTLFRNGPGLLDINGEKIKHPFDGDGMICAIAIKNGQAYFQNKFVRTEGYLAEQKAQKILYRGIFGTEKSGGWLANIFDLKTKNIANTNVIYWGNKLLALWEGADPYQLDPYTLETLGIDDINGTLKKGQPFSAHPRLDPSCKMEKGEPSLVNFSVKPGPKTQITIYEMNRHGEVTKNHTHEVPGFCFLHDMAITPNYCIFLQNPISLYPLPYILGLKSVGQCLKFNPKLPSKVIIIPRNGKEPVKILETAPCFVFHHANAHEEENKIILDSIAYDSFPSPDPNEDFREVKFAQLPAGNLTRFTIDLETGKVSNQLIDQRCCEFPTIHPDLVGRKNRFVYIGAAEPPTGNHPLQTIMKVDLIERKIQTWTIAPKGFIGEPIFIPRANATMEDEGWLLVLAYNATHHRSDLIIIDASDLNTVATLHLKQHIPYGLHGNFTSECFIPD
jgi:all-trans-8'-apo-beta-carotenal 15,15'-oxygenase